MSELKKMTRMGSDSRKLAALLQKKAPKGHMLAYINQEEADLLKAHGGSGEPHADTGIPSFELDDSFALQGEGGLQDITGTQATPQTYGGDTYSGGLQPLTQGEITSLPVTPVTVGAEPQAAAPQTSFSAFGDVVPAGSAAARLADPTGLAETQLALTSQAPQEPGLVDKLSKTTGMSKDTLARLGLAGGLGLLGARQASRAQQAGQRGAQQMQQLAQPYQQAGQAAQAAAQRGELLPVGQQSLQAARAQIAQDVTRRGGVGAEQAAAQMEALRQQLLQQQYDYGLKLSGIGDNIALGAIRTGMQADQYVNQLTNSLYSNMAYIASGMSPGVRIG